MKRILKFITKTEHKARPKIFKHFDAISIQNLIGSIYFFLELAGA